MKITVITVTYNSAMTIADAVESVLRQSYDDIEYIVIDGNSTDRTLDIVRRYEPSFTGRMRLLSEPDGGIYDAMNKGLSLATGDVVGFLNSDDYFTSNDILSVVAGEFAKNNTDIVYGDVHFIHNGSPQKVVRYYSSRLFRPCWLRFGFMPAHPSVYVRKKVYEEVGPYKTDYAIGADFEMIVRLFHGHRFKSEYIRRDFVTMRTGGISTRGMRSRKILLREDTRACRENGIRTNPLLICLKYLYKVFEIRLL